ncbi:TniQ family protein [Kitasatospora phosalacinea]|nr:TniQ family protein [Kitasatospora phosalacinea]
MNADDENHGRSPLAMVPRTPSPMPRRLPQVPLPQDSESLISWLDFMALDWGVPRGRVAELVGLVTSPDDRHALSPAGTLMYAIDGPAVGRVFAAAGLVSAELDVMTLSRYWGTAVGLGTADRPDEEVHLRLPTGTRFLYIGRAISISVGIQREWVHPSSVSICPRCLYENHGRWPTSWYLPWSVVCPTHHCYLLSACPGCGNRFEPARTGFGRGLCGHSTTGRRGGRCGAELDHLPAPPLRDRELLDLQVWLMELMEVQGVARQGAHQIFGDLWAMACFALYMGQPRHLDGADAVVRRAFGSFREEFAHPLNGGLWLTPAQRADVHDTLVLAGALRIAGRIVRAEDPYAAAGLVEALEARPRSVGWRALRTGWNGASPLASAREAAGPRLGSLMRALLTPKQFEYDQSARRQAGLEHLSDREPEDGLGKVTR